MGIRQAAGAAYRGFGAGVMKGLKARLNGRRTLQGIPREPLMRTVSARRSSVPGGVGEHQESMANETDCSCFDFPVPCPAVGGLGLAATEARVLPSTVAGKRTSNVRFRASDRSTGFCRWSSPRPTDDNPASLTSE